MAQLQKFHLTMDFTQISDKGFNSIAKALGNKKDLNELVLSFIECNIKSNSGLTYLGSSIHHMENLETFDLTFTKTKTNQKGFKELVTNLKNKKSLTCLKLDFGKTQIRDDSAREQDV